MNKPLTLDRFCITGDISELKQLYQDLLQCKGGQETFKKDAWWAKYFDEFWSNDMLYVSPQISNLSYDEKKDIVYFEGDGSCHSSVKRILECCFTHLKYYYIYTYAEYTETNDRSHAFFDYYEYDFIDIDGCHYQGHSECECVEQFNKKNGTSRNTLFNKRGIHNATSINKDQVDLTSSAILFAHLTHKQYYDLSQRAKQLGKTAEKLAEDILTEFIGK